MHLRGGVPRPSAHTLAERVVVPAQHGHHDHGRGVVVVVIGRRRGRRTREEGGRDANAHGRDAFDEVFEFSERVRGVARVVVFVGRGGGPQFVVPRAPEDLLELACEVREGVDDGRGGRGDVSGDDEGREGRVDGERARPVGVRADVGVEVGDGVDGPPARARGGRRESLEGRTVAIGAFAVDRGNGASRRGARAAASAMASAMSATYSSRVVGGPRASRIAESGLPGAGG